MFKPWLIAFSLALAPSFSHAADDVDAELNDVEPIADGASENPRIEANQQKPESRPSAASGEKIFDWNQHKGETEVKHPYAEKGLIRIDRNKVYYYKVPESDAPRAMSMQFGVFNPTNLRNPETSSSSGTFAANYDQTSNPAVILTREWRLFDGMLGKLGLRIGSGAFVAQGHGHFHSDSGTAKNADKTPMEVLTFLAMPNSAGVVYRLKFSDRPLFVPYAEGGGTYFTFMEFRDDNKGPKFGGSLAAYAAAGLGLNLTWFDYLSRIRLDAEYGINAVYLTAEYRRIQAIQTKFDFTSDFINGGFLMEY